MMATTDAQETVETRVFTGVAVGMAIGAVVCAFAWVGIVLLAHTLSDFALGPMLLVGIVCGILAGVFLGGSIGALRGSALLEHQEKASLPKP
jgi:hypothetical protein